mgnify:FL=1
MNVVLSTSILIVESLIEKSFILFKLLLQLILYLTIVNTLFFGIYLGQSCFKSL